MCITSHQNHSKVCGLVHEATERMAESDGDVSMKFADTFLSKKVAGGYGHNEGRGMALPGLEQLGSWTVVRGAAQRGVRSPSARILIARSHSIRISALPG
jgi:hypothetical protein